MHCQLPDFSSSGSGLLPDAGTTVYKRDLRGLVIEATDGRNITTYYGYDNAGRPTIKVSQTFTDPEDVTYTYDSIVSGNKGKGRLTKVQDQSGTTEFTYNALGQITADKRTIGTKIYTTSYLYKSAGNVTQMTSPPPLTPRAALSSTRGTALARSRG